MAAALVAGPARSAHSQTFSVATMTEPASVAAGGSEAVFAAIFATAAAQGYSVNLTISSGGTVVASQSWPVSFPAFQMEMEAFDWAVPASAVSGAYTVTVQVADPSGAVRKTSTASFTVAGSSVSTATNGSCATVAASATVPSGTLCNAGNASVVTESSGGSWQWTCLGTNGGTSASCTAPVAAGANGICGNTAPASVMPTTNLCAPGGGTPSVVNGTGPWEWTCTGPSGSVICTAAVLVVTNGACGPAAVPTTGIPTTGLCAPGGGTASTVTGIGPWNWTCAGANGGTSAGCTATVLTTPASGVCGTANGAPLSAAPANTGADPNVLCQFGTQSAVSGSGPWTWSCAGLNGGLTAPCEAPKAGGGGTVSGACGTLASLPPAAGSTGSCLSGTASKVMGNGPWEWTCMGSGGGSNVICQAKPAPTMGQCGTADGSHMTTAPANTTANPYVLCAQGKGVASSVAGTGPWDWSCTGTGGTVPCTADPPAVNGTCGAASGVGVATQPTINLCAPGGGTPTAVTPQGTSGWTWTCEGLYGGSNSQTCTASLVVNGACGAAIATPTTVAPTGSNGLCDAGNATAVTGTGPWHWSCSGIGGGTTATCTALVSAVNGACGLADTTPVSTAPAANLCSAGNATAVTGTGPWSWVCDGLNGGANSQTCTAPVATSGTNGQCGPAIKVATNTAPSGNSNLCLAGNPTTVTGNGSSPWLWDCLGTNGGTDAQCTAPLGTVAAAACGTPPSLPPTASLCAAGTPTAVTQDGSDYLWSCFVVANGTEVGCQAGPVPVNGACGTADKTTMNSAPANTGANPNVLCAPGGGTASTVTSQGASGWTWTCAGTNGGLPAACYANVTTTNGKCGSADGQPLSGPPSSKSALCSDGTPTTVVALSANGPWIWGCLGTGGGTPAPCEASGPGSGGGGTTGQGGPFPLEPPPVCDPNKDITIAVGSSIQGAIQGQPAGTTFCLPAGTWNGQANIVPQPGDVFIGDPGGGTILDGNNGVNASFESNGTVANVTLANMTIQHYVTGASLDSLEKAEVSGGIDPGPGWILNNVTAQFNGAVGVLVNSDNIKIYGGHYNNNGMIGIAGGSQASGDVIAGVEAADNFTLPQDTLGSAAGIKLLNKNNLTIAYNYVHDNGANNSSATVINNATGAMGIWCDTCRTGGSVVIEYNTVIHNTGSGIKFEVSDGGTIMNNVVNDNGSAGAGTSNLDLGESSQDLDVHDNNVTVDTNQSGWFIQSELRGVTGNPGSGTSCSTASPACPLIPQNVNVHNNTFTFTGLDPTGLFTGFSKNPQTQPSTGVTVDDNSYCVQSLSDAYWRWQQSYGDGWSPETWSSYLASNNGNETHSTQAVCNQSLAGCTQAGCSTDPTQ